MEKCLKPIQKTEKESVNLETQVNHHYVASSLLRLVNSEDTKRSNYSPRLVFSRFFDIRENLGNVKEKPTRKTCFSCEKKRLAPRIYQAKLCLAAFL